MMPLKFFLNIKSWAQALEPVGAEAPGDALCHPVFYDMDLRQLADLPLPSPADGRLQEEQERPAIPLARCA